MDIQSLSIFAAGLYQGGMSAVKIAALAGCGSSQVYRALDAASVQRRKPTDHDGVPKKIHLPSDKVKARYEAGETVAELSASFGVGFGTIQRCLKSSGAKMRLNSGEKFGHMAPKWVEMYTTEKLSLDAIGAATNSDPSTVRRYLKINGVDLRPDSSVPVHDHISPCAGSVRLRGSWELAYAKILDIWFLDGLILGWSHETVKVPVDSAGHYYLPDFVVKTASGSVFHEVKGFMREKSRVKLQAVRDSGTKVVLVTGGILGALCAHYGIPFRA